MNLPSHVTVRMVDDNRFSVLMDASHLGPGSHAAIECERSLVGPLVTTLLADGTYTTSVETLSVETLDDPGSDDSVPATGVDGIEPEEPDGDET